MFKQLQFGMKKRGHLKFLNMVSQYLEKNLCRYHKINQSHHHNKLNHKVKIENRSEDRELVQAKVVGKEMEKVQDLAVDLARVLEVDLAPVPAVDLARVLEVDLAPVREVDLVLDQVVVLVVEEVPAEQFHNIDKFHLQEDTDNLVLHPINF